MNKYTLAIAVKIFCCMIFLAASFYLVKDGICVLEDDAICGITRLSVGIFLAIFGLIGLRT